ncbi:hypothetical protein [Chelativorans salis]|uniref:Uncharacterized protein n=1 Tax=Chelativorans salis TaxID=2978478 RepID=A0ABT2LVN6_9HYPH|nr:hypothetical protein [Chelativorans sp. EGI FJ00035]MCT7378595.1 hypothetical protein [Chelativorans sp. EGI FJ00035]
MRVPVAAATALLLLAPAGFGAQAYAQGAERFRLEKTESGYMRMDTQTGAMSLCRERSGQLVCNVAADEREAYETEIEALRERVSALEARVEALEERAGEVTSTLPSEEEFEQTLGLMERFFRRFMDIVKGLEEDRGQEQGATPNRT